MIHLYECVFKHAYVIVLSSTSLSIVFSIIIIIFRMTFIEFSMFFIIVSINFDSYDIFKDLHQIFNSIHWSQPLVPASVRSTQSHARQITRGGGGSILIVSLRIFKGFSMIFIGLSLGTFHSIARLTGHGGWGGCLPGLGT